MIHVVLAVGCSWRIPFGCGLGVGLGEFWGEFYDCGFDIVGAVLRLELVPVVEVGHHAAHNFEAVSLQRPAHVLEVVDARYGGV